MARWPSAGSSEAVVCSAPAAAPMLLAHGCAGACAWTGAVHSGSAEHGLLHATRTQHWGQKEGQHASRRACVRICASASAGGSASGGQPEVMRTRTRLSPVAVSCCSADGVCWLASGRAASSWGVGCAAAGTVALVGAVSAGEDATWLPGRQAVASSAAGCAAGGMPIIALPSSAGDAAGELALQHAASCAAAGRCAPAASACVAGGGDSGRLASGHSAPRTMVMHSADGSQASVLCCAAGGAAGCPASGHAAAAASATGRPGWSAGAAESGSAGMPAWLVLELPCAAENEFLFAREYVLPGTNPGEHVRADAVFKVVENYKRSCRRTAGSYKHRRKRRVCTRGKYCSPAAAVGHQRPLCRRRQARWAPLPPVRVKLSPHYQPARSAICRVTASCAPNEC